MKRIFLFASLAAAIGCGTTVDSARTATGGSGGGGGGGDETPSLPEGLSDGWNEIKPGGDTICSRGSEYAYWVRPGKVNKVVLDFIGGGACWNELTCSIAGQIFSPDVENVREAVEENEPQGFYQHDNSDNPFADWYHVVIPYCTGDIHWGDATVKYSDEVTIHHRGAVNTRAVLDWVYDNFSGPEQVMVTGCSAGSYGSSMWAAHVAEHYPKSRVMQFGDSGAGIITKDFFEQSFPSWNAEPVFPTWIGGLNPGEVNVLELELTDLYVELANHYGENRFSQYNTAFDDNQVFYFQAMGGGDAGQWSQRMFESIHEIQNRAPDFAAFIPSGEQHCILPYDNFYTVNVGGVRLVDWLRDMIDGKPPVSLECDACDEPTP